MSKEAMKRITRDDTEHGVEYYRADEVDALLAEQPPQRQQRKPFAWANADDLSADTAFRWCEIGDHKTPVYTSPPAQRTWVGLTDEQLDDVYFCVEGGSSAIETWREQARAIEARLKEKNT